MAAAILFAQLALAAGAPPTAWSGFVEAEYRAFTESALSPSQHGGYFSIAAQPEYYWKSARGADSFTFVGFARADRHDDERSHGDIRELTWLHVGEGFEARAGVRKLFWGVTEAQHLVDVINQTDFVEDIESEDKLGQPMLNLAFPYARGAFDIFILPGFRERSFPGVEGRPRTELVVDTDRAQYASPRGREHVDYAARLSHTIGAWDLGLSYFSGTNRDPRLLPAVTASGALVLVPYYDQMEQTGVDVQATIGAWLWKLETIYRAADSAPYAAASAGFEYTFTGAWAGKDLGVIVEYLWDERQALAPTLFQDDVMLGLRLGFNDEHSSEALLGVIADAGNHGRMFSAEASRRVAEHWKIGAKAKIFDNISPADPLYSFRNDDYLEITLGFYF